MRKSMGTVILTLLIGALIGSILGQVIGLFLNEGSIAHQLFVKEQTLGFDAVNWDLKIIDLTFGFHFHFNVMSVVGIFIASQMLRWYR